MGQMFSNNASSTLASGINAGNTSITVQTGHGSKFPSPTLGTDYFLATLSSGSAIEIIKCTARSGDVLTITRAQEGTTAQSWSSGTTVVDMRITKGTMENIVSTAATWPSTNLTYITTLTASNSSDLISPSLAVYTNKSFEFRFSNIKPVNSNVTFNCRVYTGTGGGETLHSANGDYSWTDDQGTRSVTNINTISLVGNYTINTGSVPGLTGTMTAFNIADTTVGKMILTETSFPRYSDSLLIPGYSVGVYKSTSAITKFKFYMSSGNISSGSIQIWGY